MGIRKDKDRKYWIYQFQYQGKNYGGRGFASRRAAETARAKRRQQIKDLSKQTLPGMGFKEAASAYLDHSERKHAKATYQYKALIYKTFIQSQGNKVITDITPADISNYLLELPTNALYNARRKDLSALFEWVIDTYSLSMKNPCKKVKKMAGTYKIKDIPTEEEILKIIFVARPGDEQDIIMCCIHLLGRIDEILRMTWQDINFEKRAVTLWTRKRKDGAYEPDDLPMNDDLYQNLKKRYDKRNSEKWVFYNGKAKDGQGDRFYHRPKMMASLCKRAGIEPIGYSRRRHNKGKRKGQYYDAPLYYGFHALRHFMASHLIDSEKTSLKSVSNLLRHKNLKTTEIYIHSIDESVRATMTGIEGKFTPKTEKPIHLSDTQKEKGVNENG
jgi:integrase